MKKKGGRSIYGTEIGVLMLESAFPRIPGDIGNALTWHFPVNYKLVKGANPDLVVRKGAEGLLENFIRAALELEKEGVSGITTSCGFLSIFQSDIAKACNVPVACSSLLQYRMIDSLLSPDKRVGIITISQEALSPRHLSAMGIPEDAAIVGVNRQGEFSRVILNGELEMDVVACENDLTAAAQNLLTQYSDIGAILLECTNMPPYARKLRKITGLPVFDIVSLIEWFHRSLNPVNYFHKVDE